MATHAVIGLALPVLTFLHAWFSMKLPGIREASATGLWIATLGLLVLLAQAFIGVSMLAMKERTGIRRLHLVSAVILACLVGIHLVLNG